jgi:hypothetical protein
MLTAIPLFDRFTALDAVGPHQVLTHLPGGKSHFFWPNGRVVSPTSQALSLSRQKPRSPTSSTRTSSSSPGAQARPATWARDRPARDPSQQLGSALDAVLG